MNIPVEILAVLLSALLAVNGWSLKLLLDLVTRVTALETRLANSPKKTNL